MKFIHDPIKVQVFLNSLEASFCQKESELFLCDDPNEAFFIFNNEYFSNVEKFATLETFRKQPKLEPNWLNNSLENLKMKRKQAHRNLKQIGNSASLPSFYDHRNKFEVAYKKAKEGFLLINSGPVLVTLNKLLNYLMNSVAEVCNPLRYQYFVRVMK